MFTVEPVQEGVCLVLEHSDQIFHEAHSTAENRIRVHNPRGEDYELVRIKNDDYRSTYSKLRWGENLFFYDYETYDENALSTVYLPFLRKYRAFIIETVSEYSFVLAKLILAHTDSPIYCLDERFLWFIEPNARLFFHCKTPEFQEGEVLRIKTDENEDMMDRRFRCMGPIEAFQNVFFLQGSGIFDLEKIRYVEITMDEKAGIGSVLVNLSKFSQAFDSIGLKLVSHRDKLGQYPMDAMNRQFSFHLDISDVADGNTAFIPSAVPLITTYFVKQNDPILDKRMFRPEFYSEMKEYLNAVKRNRRILGVLIRGTDYILVNGNTDRRMASVENVIPILDDWMEKYNYEAVFLATEDQDIFQRMREHFGRRLIAISQERYSLQDLHGEKLLADVEKEKDGDNLILDTTENYLYALVILAHCESFICSGLCNGYDMTLAINRNHFEHVGLFEQGELKIKK